MSIIEKHKRGKLYSAFLLLSLLVFAAVARPAVAGKIPADDSAAVIFAYQRIGDDSFPQGSLSLDQFKAHIQALKADRYAVRPLADIAADIKAGKKLNQKTVAITFDGAWTSTLAVAVPLLTEAKMPFTIFIAADMADSATGGHAGWRDLAALKDNKYASFGIFPASYARLPAMTADAASASINRSLSRFREEMGLSPVLFAYPYGEYDRKTKTLLQNYTFTAAVGQHSGVMHAGSDFMALPRFTMTDQYGDLERFTLTINALPLPVTDVTPDDTLVDQNPPHIGFTVGPDIGSLAKLSCFVSGLGKMPLARIGGGRVELRLEMPLEDRNTRINCTLPEDIVVPGIGQSWRWFGWQLVNPSVTLEADQENDLPQ